MRKQREMSWDSSFSFIEGGFPLVTGPLERDSTVNLFKSVVNGSGSLFLSRKISEAKRKTEKIFFKRGKIKEMCQMEARMLGKW